VVRQTSCETPEGVWEGIEIDGARRRRGVRPKSAGFVLAFEDIAQHLLALTDQPLVTIIRFECRDRLRCDVRHPLEDSRAARTEHSCELDVVMQRRKRHLNHEGPSGQIAAEVVCSLNAAQPPEREVLESHISNALCNGGKLQKVERRKDVRACRFEPKASRIVPNHSFQRWRWHDKYA
jgi:hypothetical protein